MYPHQINKGAANLKELLVQIKEQKEKALDDEKNMEYESNPLSFSSFHHCPF